MHMMKNEECGTFYRFLPISFPLLSSLFYTRIVKKSLVGNSVHYHPNNACTTNEMLGNFERDGGGRGGGLPRKPLRLVWLYVPQQGDFPHEGL